MSNLLGIVGFVLLLLISVMVHEWGHFAAARRFGMKVTEFFVGFGPKLWSVRRGETEYGVKAIPAGGYVRIVGMTELDQVEAEDEPRAFFRAPAGQRSVVLAAGSFMHFVIGAALLLFVFMALGSPTPSTTLTEVSTCVPAKASAGCTSTDPVSPAAAAGLRAGDRIVAVDGTPVDAWAQISARIRAAAGADLRLTFERAGARQEVTVTPAAVDRPDPDTGATTRVGFLGVTPSTVMQRSGPVDAVKETVTGIGGVLKGTAQALWTLPQKTVELAKVLFLGGERDPNGLVGIVGAADISGQLASTDAPVAARVGDVLIVVAAFNVFVGVFNMLPLLPLDGGHLAVLWFEALRSRWARLRGRPDPGRVDTNRLLPFAYAVFVLFVGLTALVVAADIAKPVQLG